MLIDIGFLVLCWLKQARKQLNFNQQLNGRTSTSKDNWQINGGSSAIAIDIVCLNRAMSQN